MDENKIYIRVFYMPNTVEFKLSRSHTIYTGYESGSFI